MQLSHEQIHEYQERGYLVLDGLLAAEEVAALHDAFRRDRAVPGDHRVAENDSEEIRAVYASHTRQPEFAALIRTPGLLGPVQQLLADDVYVYQFKINSKAPFSGSGWSWHQDYAAWRLADNLPAPRLVNVGVFLDEVTEFNGPIVVLPGSHRDGLVKTPGRVGAAASEQHLDPADIALTAQELTGLVERHGMVSVLGAPGTVVLFHPELVHGSASNMSPAARTLLLMTYNEVGNAPRPVGTPRPEYIVCRDTTPLTIAGLQPAGAVAAGVAG